MPEREGQSDIGNIYGIAKQRSYISIGKTGNATTDTRYQKAILGMGTGKRDKFIDIGFYHLHTRPHGRYGIGLPRKSATYAPFGPEPFICDKCGSSVMSSRQITTENENFILFQRLDMIGSNTVRRYMRHI